MNIRARHVSPAYRRSRRRLTAYLLESSSLDNMHTRSANDDFDFGMLLQKIWSARWLIAIITVAFTAVFALYAFITPPTYKTTAEVLPPSASDLAPYNFAYQTLNSAAIPSLRPDDAYQIFLRKLSSYSQRLDFFEKVYVPANRALLDEVGRTRLWNKYSREVGIGRAHVTITGEDPELIAKWATEYIDMASKEAQAELLQNLNVALEAYKKNTTTRIAALREGALESRHALIQRLKDALKIAESINLQEPHVTLVLRDKDYTDEPLYLRGARALKSELADLESRKDDDAYIPGLSQLRHIEYMFKTQTLAPESFNVMVVDQHAETPDIPIKPQKAMLITLGLILGLMIGLIAALLVPTPKHRQPE